MRSSFVVFVFALAVTGSVYAGGQSCTRHIYNNSDKPWVFKAGGDNQDGNVYFGKNAKNCVNTQNGPCTIPPKTTVAISFTSTENMIGGTMYITDYLKKQRSYSYGDNLIEGICVKIHHDGDTGSVSMNDPSDGDYSIWQPHW